MKLSDIAVRSAKAKPKSYKISDGAGMYLLVQPNNNKYWRLDYRFGGKRKTLVLGVYPQVSLKAAREKRDEAKRQLSDGIDPGHSRKIEKLTGAANAETTFRAVAEELIEKMVREERAKITIDKTKWVFEFAYPYFGDRPNCRDYSAGNSSCTKIRRGSRQVRNRKTASQQNWAGFSASRCDRPRRTGSHDRFTRSHYSAESQTLRNHYMRTPRHH